MNTKIDGYDDGYVSDEDVRRILDAYQNKKMMENMVGPGISMTVHTMVLILGFLFITLRPEEKKPDMVVQTYRLDPVVLDDMPEIPLPDPDPIKEIKPTLDSPDPSKEAFKEAAKDASQVDVDVELPPADESTNMQEVSAVVQTNSVVTFPGPIGKRGPKGRGDALRDHDAGPGGDRAVNKALRWLASVQNENGSWGDLKKTFCYEPGHPAHTGLALMVFLAHGETPMSETYGPTVQRAIRWLSMYGTQSDLQTIVSKKHGAYTHGIATYALAEAYAMTKIPFVQAAMENSIEVVVGGQMANGGFGYGYTSGVRWDMSVAGWNMQALKAARMAGSSNDKLGEAIRKSIGFCKVAYGGNGNFGYAEKPGGGRPNMGGVGTVAMQLLGVQNDRRVTEGCARIGTVRLQEYETVMADPTQWEAVSSKSLYGWYYDTQALFNTNKQNKPRWKRWQRAFESVLVRAQHKEGYWQTAGHAGGNGTAGRVLTTCFAALQLEVYYRYLPTFDNKALEKNSADEMGDGVDALGTGTESGIRITL